MSDQNIHQNIGTTFDNANENSRKMPTPFRKNKIEEICVFMEQKSKQSSTLI